MSYLENKRVGVPCLIPARGGSKGIKNKNLQLLGGKPLINWPIRAALASVSVGSVICSTDSSTIAQVARNAGATVSHRPPHLATDDALIIHTIRHELALLRERSRTDIEYLCLLQPTSPFVTAEIIEATLSVAVRERFDVVCTARRVGADHPDAMFTRAANGSVRWLTTGDARSRRRQDGDALLVRSGLVYVFRAEHIDTCGDDYFNGSTGCVEVDAALAQSIDDQIDLAFCQFLLDNGTCRPPTGFIHETP